MIRRFPPLKIAFNVGMYVPAIAVAQLAYELLGSHDPVEPMTWIAAAASARPFNQPIVTRISALGEWTNCLPGAAASALRQVSQTNEEFLEPWLGGIVLAAYGIAFALGGTVLAVRRE